MPVLRGLVIVVACCAGFGVAGGLLGYTLGAGAPAYYRGVFGAGNDPAFRPIQVGLGLGLSQGLLCGVAVGCVAVLATALAGRHRPKDRPDDFAGEPVDARRAASPLHRRVVMALLILAAIAGGGLVGFVAGALFVSMQSVRLRSEAALAKVEPVLKSGFAGVSASVCPVHGELDMNGTVASEGEYRALQEKVRFLVGDEEANSMMRGVSVASPEQGTGPARP